MRAATFSVTVTHADSDRAGEVAEAFAKLAVFMGDNFGRQLDIRGGGATSSPLRPYRHGVEGGPIIGWRFDVTVRGPDDHSTLTLASNVRARMADAGKEDGQGCNFSFSGALLSLLDLPEEIIERRSRA